jgi:hypothetical protein
MSGLSSIWRNVQLLKGQRKNKLQSSDRKGAASGRPLVQPRCKIRKESGLWDIVSV